MPTFDAKNLNSNLDRVLTHMVATHVLALTLVPNFGERYDGQVRLKLQWKRHNI